MLEDGEDTRGNPTGVVRPPIDSYPPAASARPPIDSSSSFGRLSAVRTNLYELCLAILLGGHSSARADSRTAFDIKAVREVGLEGGSTAGPDQFGGGVFVPSSRGDRSAVRTKTPLREGDRWVVKEFRRAGESVKPVQVFCQVRDMFVFLPGCFWDTI